MRYWKWSVVLVPRMRLKYKSLCGTAGTGILGPGQWLWRTSQEAFESDVDTPLSICQSWLLRQMDDSDLQSLFDTNSQLLPACPCSFDRIDLDPRFTRSIQPGCAVSTFPVPGRTFAQARPLVDFKPWLCVKWINYFEIYWNYFSVLCHM